MFKSATLVVPKQRVSVLSDNGILCEVQTKDGHVMSVPRTWLKRISIFRRLIRR